MKISSQLLSLIKLFPLVVLFVSGCANLSQPQLSSVSWPERETKLATLTQWDMKGKIAIRTPNNSGSAALNWQERHPNYTISLYSPLGSPSVKLIGQPGKAILETSSGQRFSASTPEELLLQQTNWNLPVSNLYYWVRGLPVPGIPSDTQFDKYHHISRLTQQGWVIDYMHYTEVGGKEVPDLMVMESAEIRVKLIIYEWTLI